MTQICAACQTANRDVAKYCRACARRLSLPRDAQASTDSAFRLSEPVPIVAPRGLDRSVLWLLVLLVVSSACFVLWYGSRRAALRAPALPPAAMAQLPAEAVAPPERLVAAALGTAPPSATPPAPRVEPATAAGEAVGTPVTLVASFYRALSAGDGDAAAALITPAKRGVGPFNPSTMSRFYRSFKEPLVLRSIRQIGANVVEAKYSYRVTRTVCEGTAIVETETGRGRPLIRRIRANC